MFDRLPYTLTTGVTAALEGLVFDSVLQVAAEYFSYRGNPTLDGPIVIEWPDAVERLRYREGEPWCFCHNETDTGEAVIELASHPICRELFPILHRIAAILCDDAEAFRVLHWCVTELGGNDE